MPEIRRTVNVPCSADEMYAIVDDVEAYPDFLEWCTEAEEERRDDDELIAWLALSRSGAQGRFRIRHDLDPGHSIALAVLDGPIQDLAGTWYFQPRGDDDSSLTFDVEYGRRGGFLAMMMAPLVAEIADGLLDAFFDRAVELYGDAQ